MRADLLIMDFRASGQSNERRRRVRADDSVLATLPIRRPARSEGTGPRYAEAARPDRQPRLMDLVPLRMLWQNLVVLSGVLVIAALLAGNWAAQRAGAAMPHDAIRPFDVHASDSLAAWMRAGMLAAAAATAVLVYVVRRHRTDDYRGGYRIWLWAAAWMMVMSADAVARLRDAWRAAAVAQFGWTGPGNGIVWWAVPCALAAATIGVRLFLDMRDSRASTAWLCLAGPTWSLGEVFMAIRPAFGDALPFDLIAAGCSFAGQWCLFVAMSWHARHVVLDASGGLRVRKKKKSRRNAAATEQSSATSRSATGSADQSKSRPAPSTTSAVVAKSPVAKTNAAAAESTLATKLTFGGRAANETSRDGGHLSKAERKKLKRDMRRAA